MERVLLFFGEFDIAVFSWRLKELSSKESYRLLPQSQTFPLETWLRISSLDFDFFSMCVGDCWNYVYRIREDIMDEKMEKRVGESDV